MNHHIINTWFRRVRATVLQARSSSYPTHHDRTRAFTLVEMLVAMTVLAVLVLMIGSIFNQAHRGWISAQNRTECYAEARMIMEAMTRDLHEAVAGGGITFKGSATKFSMVASQGDASLESADLAEVGYVYDPNLRMIVRRYTGPIGSQPDYGSGSSSSATYQAALGLTSGSGQIMGSTDSWCSRGTRFLVNKTIYITHVGIVDGLVNGVLNAPNVAQLKDIALATYTGATVSSPYVNPAGKTGQWELNPSSMVAVGPYLFMEISEFEVPPGEYMLYSNYFCLVNNADQLTNERFWTGSTSLDSNGGVLTKISDLTSTRNSNLCKGTLFTTAGYGIPASLSANQAVNFKYSLTSSSGGGGSTPNVDGVPGSTGKWNIYNNSWDADDSWDRRDVLASNNVTAVSFEYGTDAANLGSTYSGATLPNVVRISVSVVDRRAAQALAVGGQGGVALPAITNDWGHTFSTLVHLTNADQ